MRDVDRLLESTVSETVRQSVRPPAFRSIAARGNSRRRWSQALVVAAVALGTAGIVSISQLMTGTPAPPPRPRQPSLGGRHLTTLRRSMARDAGPT